MTAGKLQLYISIIAKGAGLVWLSYPSLNCNFMEEFHGHAFIFGSSGVSI